MHIDPNTTIRGLIAALPTLAPLLNSMGVSNGAHDERTLQQACSDAGIPMETIFKLLDDLDWDAEPQSQQ